MESERYPTCPVGELLSTIIDYRGKTPPKSPAGIPLISAANVKRGRVVLEDPEFISPEDYKLWTRRGFTEAGDVLITTEAPVGEVAPYPPEGVCQISRRVMALRPDRAKVDHRFLNFALQWDIVKNRLLSRSRGSTVPRVLKTDITSLEIPCPALAIQKRVGQILGALDDKIELNRGMNATLEQLARALFKSWFVDFDPIAARAAGRQPPHMSPATAALFTDRFVDSDLGPIPEGWGVGSVEDFIDGLFDGPHATPPPSDSGPIFLGIKNLTGTQIDLSTIRHISEDDWPRWTRRIEPREDDIVFTYEATIGFFALVPPDVRCCLGRRLAVIRPKAHSEYLFHWFTAPPFQDVLEARTVHGSTVPRTSLIEFPRYPVLAPPTSLIAAFCRVAKRIWERIHLNQEETRNLNVIRDSLLPQLLSGKIRLKKAERLVQEVL